MKKTIFLLINVSMIYCRCPIPEQLHPCSCDIIGGDPAIHCFGSQIKELPQILLQLNGNNFEELIIHNTSITTISNNSFGNVTFYEYIHISHNSLLTNIDSNSFKKGPKTLSIVGNKKLMGEVIFGLIKNSEDSQTLDLQSNAITEIPAFAFKLNNNLTKSKVKEINLSNNNISKIGKNGLTLSSPLKIDISLINNSLNEKSFQDISLQNNDSVLLNIDFSNNSFTKLPENIFRYYLKNKNNSLTFGSTKFQCDCDMSWILNDRIENQMNDIKCVNYHNKSIFNLTESDSKCFTSQTTPLTIFSTTISPLNTCPSPQDLKPCTCDHNILTFNCEKNIINSELLTRIWLKIKTQNTFRLLSIHETNITTISRDTFINTRVENIFIQNNDNFKTIDTKAFNDKQEIKSFILRNNSNFNDLNIFELIKNLDPFEVDLSGNSLDEIPSEAFVDENEIKTYRIKSLKLDYNKLEIIGSNAFIGLTNLTHLSLNHNMIKTLEDYSLKFTSISTHIFVSLKNNFLDNNSFTERTIGLKLNSTISLNLDNNNLTSLKENVFSKLIDSSDENRLNFFGNKFVCNCNMKWILNITHRNSFLNIFCSNKIKSLFDLRETDLSCI